MSVAPFKVKSPLDVRGNVGIGIEPSNDYELLVNGTKGIVIPGGTSVQSPPQRNGLIRYNTELKQAHISREGQWRTIGKLDSGSQTPLPSAGQLNDVFVLLNSGSTLVQDVLVYNGTAWVSLMTSVNQSINTINTSITNIQTQVNTLDFGEY